MSLFCAVLLWAQGAAAQDVDPSVFSPALSPTSGLSVGATLPVSHLAAWGGLFVSYANDELVTRVAADETVHGPLRNRTIGTLAAGLGLYGVLDVAIGAPVLLIERGDSDTRQTDAAFGDLRLALRGRIFGVDAGEDGLGAAVLLDLGFPTGTASFAGEGGVSLHPRLAVDFRTASGLLASLNVGALVRPDADVGDVAIGDEVRFGALLEVPVGLYGLSILGEVIGALGFGESAVDDAFLSARKVPVEGLVGLRWRADVGLAISAAAGAGFTSGYGAPDYRAFVGLTYGGPAPAAYAEPMVLEVPPEDREAAERLAREPAAAAPSLADDRVFDEVASSDPDGDSDGITVPEDRCPSQPEDRDGFEDEDGCPEPDNDGDGIADADDACPNVPEVFNGVDDEDGCHDEGGQAPAIKDEGGTLIIEDKIGFGSGNAELTEQGESVLDQVVLFMKGHPHIFRYRIEGHTDNFGDREYNVDLSERRAWSVRTYLIAHGISGEKLLPKGFGPTKPVASNGTKAGRAQNRRVVFTIIRTPEALEELEAAEKKAEEGGR